MQNNKLQDLQDLQQLPRLKVLNISQNELSTLAGIEASRELNTLICSKNKLVSLQSVQPLADCPLLTTLDIQDNHLNDARVLLATLLEKHSKKCLTLLWPEHCEAPSCFYDALSNGGYDAGG